MRPSINALRAELRKRGLKAYVVPNNDEFGSEYLPDSAKRLEYLTGFTGSAATAVVGLNKAAFFTDGRYTIQAQKQVDASIFEIYNIAQKRPEKWLEEQDLEAAFDPWLFSFDEARKYKTAKPLNGNLIDIIWPTKPPAPTAPTKPHDIAFAGESSESKRKRIAASLTTDMLLITSPDSLNWLLNIRGGDIKYTPFCLAYGVLHKNAKLDLYISKKKATFEILSFIGNDVKIKEPHQILEINKGSISVDRSKTPFAIYDALYQNNVDILVQKDPCQLAKAQKNPTEIAGIKHAHALDGRALTRFISWVKQQPHMTEEGAATALEAFRCENPEYKGPSFSTISAFGANGAIVHYDHTKFGSAPFTDGNLYLIDSGGQYEFGTTDVTRTIAIGDATNEMKRCYTLVLKGHIALATAKFPRGTSGAQLDALARQYLWQEGLDYDHGTGHGVGYYLSVHEGPQGISKRSSDTALLPGMILSNEPGYYKEGHFGIRIENLVLVVEQPNGFLGFETLTLAPLDNTLIMQGLLTDFERDWVHDYQEMVAKNMAG
jgi:Xaa-Pro aminopeptidase